MEDYYREQAARCAAEAAAAVLGNVRERALRSEEAWLRMAAQAAATARSRAVNQERLAAKR